MILWRDVMSLCALVLVPALALFFLWAERRRRRALATFVDSGLLPAVAPDLDPRRRTARAVLQCLGALLLIVALGGPRWGFHWQEVRRQGIDLIVAIDTSRSMLATDVKPNRLARAKLAVQDLLAQLEGDRVGLVAFAGSAFVQCPLTLDHGAFVESLNAMEVGLIPRGGTALAAAIDAGLEAFEGREGSHQALVLITDGEDHEGDVEEAAKRAGERGVKVFTVGIGTTDGELIPEGSGGFVKDRRGQVVKSRLGEETLKEIAVDTGGVYLHAGGTSLGLTELYRDYIGTMEKRDLASTLERRFEDRFQLPLALAFFLLLAEGLIGERRSTARRSWSKWRLPAAAAVVAVSSIGWLDPHAGAREGNRLFAAGKYEEAAAKYNQALVDSPGSPLLHFNLGDARYKQGQYDEALAAFGRVPAGEDDPARAARVAYNAGNAKYRLGAAAEASDPKAALGLYGEALAAYRRTMGAAPDDPDAKFNYEFVAKKLADLEKKLEEQRREQEQQQEQAQPPEQDQGSDNQEERPQEAEQPDEPDSGEREAEKEAQGQQAENEGEQPAPPESDQQQAQPQPEEQQTGGSEKTEEQHAAGTGSEETAGETGEMSRQEATALLDSQRDQEVRPDEVVKKLQAGVVAEPAEDW